MTRPTPAANYPAWEYDPRDDVSAHLWLLADGTGVLVLEDTTGEELLAEIPADALAALARAILTPTAAPHGAPDGPPAPQTDTETADGRSIQETGADGLGLRDRIAAAIREADGWVLDDGQHMIDAVLAVVQPELDRVARAEAQVRRVRRMAHAWRAQLPEVIRRDTAVQALLDATTPTP